MRTALSLFPNERRLSTAPPSHLAFLLSTEPSWRLLSSAQLPSGKAFYVLLFLLKRVAKPEPLAGATDAELLPSEVGFVRFTTFAWVGASFAVAVGLSAARVSILLSFFFASQSITVA